MPHCVPSVSSVCACLSVCVCGGGGVGGVGGGGGGVVRDMLSDVW